MRRRLENPERPPISARRKLLNRILLLRVCLRFSYQRYPIILTSLIMADVISGRTFDTFLRELRYLGMDLGLRNRHDPPVCRCMARWRYEPPSSTTHPHQLWIASLSRTLHSYRLCQFILALVDRAKLLSRGPVNKTNPDIEGMSTRSMGAVLSSPFHQPLTLCSLKSISPVTSTIL